MLGLLLINILYLKLWGLLAGGRKFILMHVLKIKSFLAGIMITLSLEYSVELNFYSNQHGENVGIEFQGV